jgi:hypothetical protein
MFAELVPLSSASGKFGSGRVQKRFSAGDRVRVAGVFFWAKGAMGTVSAPPHAVTTISGPWDEGLTRREVSALGTHTVYWVWFDEPQHDAEGDSPYRGGQIYVSVSKTKLNQAPENVPPTPKRSKPPNVTCTITALTRT